MRNKHLAVALVMVASLLSSIGLVPAKGAVAETLWVRGSGCFRRYDEDGIIGTFNLQVSGGERYVDEETGRVYYLHPQGWLKFQDRNIKVRSYELGVWEFVLESEEAHIIAPAALNKGNGWEDGFTLDVVIFDPNLGKGGSFWIWIWVPGEDFPLYDSGGYLIGGDIDIHPP